MRLDLGSIAGSSEKRINSLKLKKEEACGAKTMFFRGASQAAIAPHLGRSALDAAELMSVGVNYLREHVPQESRIHYAYLDSGGSAPNVVPASALVRYAIRSASLAGMRALIERADVSPPLKPRPDGM